MRSSESTPTTSSPLGALRHLYIGTGRFAEDMAFYREVLGAEMAEARGLKGAWRDSSNTYAVRKGGST